MSKNSDCEIDLVKIIFNTIFLCMTVFGMYLSFCDAYLYNGDKVKVFIIAFIMSLVIGICWLYNSFLSNCILMALNIAAIVIALRDYIRIEQEFRVLYEYVNRQYCKYYLIGDITISDSGTEGIELLYINVNERLLMILLMFVVLNIIAAAALRFHARYVVILPVAVLIGMELCHGKAPEIMAGFMLLCGIIGLFFNMQFNMLGGKRGLRQKRFVLNQMWNRYIIFLTVVVICFFVSNQFADMTKRPAFADAGKVLKYQHKMERKIKQAAEYVQSMVNVHGKAGYLSNKAPYQTGKLIMRIVTDKKPDGDIYIRKYMATTYKSGRWQNGDDSSKFDEQEILSMPFNVINDYKKKNYFDNGFRNHFRDGLIYVEIISENKGYDASDSVVYWSDILAAKKSSDKFALWAFNVDNLTTPDILQLSNRELRNYGIRDNGDYTSYVHDKYLEIPDGLEQLKKFSDTIVTNKNVGRQCISVKDAICKDTQYSQRLNPLPLGKDYVEYFLFDQKKGYCEHYATAGVILLRLKGVPARYVSGYHVSRDDFMKVKDETGKVTYVASVQDYEAHAWTEVYKEGFGWLPFDMSKETNDEQNGNSDNQETEMPDIERQTPKSDITPSPKAVVSNEPSKNKENKNPNDDNNEKNIGSASKSGGKIGYIIFIICIVVILITVLVCFLLKIRYIKLLRRLDNTKMVRGRVIIYSEIFNLFFRCYGIKERCSDDRQYADMLADVCGEELDYEALTGYIRILQKAVFSDREMLEADEMEFKEYIVKILTGLYGSCSRLKQWYIHISMTIGKR